MKHFITVAAVIILFSGIMMAKDKQLNPKDEKLAAVNSIFVSGNNMNAQIVRRQIEKEKHSCFTLALKGDEADAVADVSKTDEQTTWVSWTLINRAGEMIDSGSMPDADSVYWSLQHYICAAKAKVQKAK